MGRSLNRVMIIGDVGRAPEMRYMPSGRPVTSFSVGATRSWESSDGEHCEEIEWFNGVAWGELAERCKGDLSVDDCVFVEGRLQTRSWKGEDGSSRFRAELVVSDMILLDRTNEVDAVPAEAAGDQ